ncbi:MAG: transporter substrate-binding domain-containing protein [Firmicutes bacterium]|nr:transporter substrate-binding domain-containing protein [Bacillota bacterium]
MKKLIGIISIALLITLTSFMSGCTSSNIFNYIVDDSYTDYIVMGTSADYPPYEWPMNVEGTQTLVGIDIQIGLAIAAELGMNLQVVNKGFDFLLDDLSKGKVDFVIAGMTPTDERAEIVDFSMVYYEAHQVILTTLENQDNYASIEDLNLNTIRIGAQMGSIQLDLAEDTFPDSQKVYLQAVPDLIMKLSQGLIEAVLLEQPVAEGYLTNVEGLAVLEFEIGEPDGGSAVAVEKGNTELLATINAVLEDLINSGALDIIVSEAILLNSGE